MFLPFFKLHSLILLSPLIHLVPSSCCSRSCLHHSLLCCCMLPPFPSALLLTSLPIRCFLLSPYTLSPFSSFFPSPPLHLLHLSPLLPHFFIHFLTHSYRSSFSPSLTHVTLLSLGNPETEVHIMCNGKNIFENIILFFSRKRT